MPPKLLYDLDTLDLEHPEYGLEEIRRVNPQRHEFEQLSTVVLYRPDQELIIGTRDVRADEFWARGHIPGQPIFPGVLMLEAAAQLCSFYQAVYFQGKYFYGFGGVDSARFRGAVKPGDRLILVARGKVLRPRISVFASQGVVEGRLVFEADITGVRMN